MEGRGQKPPIEEETDRGNSLTVKSADYLAKIVETATRLDLGTAFKRNVRLHRINRIRSIHSSLGIEGNRLSLGEVAGVINGRIVAGGQAEIKEVKNAYEAYSKIMEFDPYSVHDFLEAHRLMTEGLIKESGKFRNTDVGVYEGDKRIHSGASPQSVPKLIEDLFLWAKNIELHPVLKSAVIHYEIEIIHPFADGNGRMGRLWQTLVLAKWNDIFAWMPMESVLYENTTEYYRAIDDSKKANDSGAFVEFSLSALLGTLERQDRHQDKRQVERQDDFSDTQLAILELLGEKTMSRKELFATIGLRADSRSIRRHLAPLLKQGLAEMTVPETPNSRLQKYRLTENGRTVLQSRLADDLSRQSGLSGSYRQL